MRVDDGSLVEAQRITAGVERMKEIQAALIEVAEQRAGLTMREAALRNEARSLRSQLVERFEALIGKEPYDRHEPLR